MNNVKINGKDLLERLATFKADDRKPVSYYVSEKLNEEFKKLCGAIGTSLVVEGLIREFVRTVKK